MTGSGLACSELPVNPAGQHKLHIYLRNVLAEQLTYPLQPFPCHFSISAFPDILRRLPHSSRSSCLASVSLCVLDNARIKKPGDSSRKCENEDCSQHTSRLGLVTLLLALSASQTTGLRATLGDLASRNSGSERVFPRTAPRSLDLRLRRRGPSVAGDWGRRGLLDLLQSYVFLHRLDLRHGEAVVRAVLPVVLVLVHDVRHVALRTFSVDQTPRTRHRRRSRVRHGWCGDRSCCGAASTIVGGCTGRDVHTRADWRQLPVEGMSCRDGRRARYCRVGSSRIRRRVRVRGRMGRVDRVQPRRGSRNHGMGVVKVQTTHMGVGPRQNPVLSNNAQRRFHSLMMEYSTKPASDQTGCWLA